MAILDSLGLEKGDEVLLQAFTCNAVPNPIIWDGFKPIYVDCDEKTFNMDIDNLKRKITDKSRALIVQHTFGLPAEMDEIIEICRQNGLILIEDCAHSLGAEYKGKKVGTFGKTAFFSFSRDKVISSVYGGMVATSDDELAKKISDYQRKIGCPSYPWIFQQLLHPVLMNWIILPSYKIFGKYLLVLFQWFHILSKAVHWKEKRGRKPGYFPKRMPAALAVLALNQFKKLERFNNYRKEIADFYRQGLEKLSFNEKKLSFQLPLDSEQIYLRFTIKHQKAHEIIKKAWQNNLLIGDWYTNPVAPYDTKLDKIGYTPGSCPNAEKLSKITLNLPTHINISKEDAQKIINFFKKMAIREIKDKNIWEDFLARCEEKTFLQSWNWGEFQEMMGNKIWRLGVYNNGGLSSALLAVKIIARRGKFLLVQHNVGISEALLNKLKEIGKEEKCDFIRMAPLMERNEVNNRIFKGLGFEEAPMHASAYEATWKLDITLPEEGILKNMRKTTRYLIRQAVENTDIMIQKSQKLSDLEVYQNLNREVAKRQNFTPFSDEYIKNEFDIFSLDDQALWLFGRYKGEVAAAALVIFWQGIGFYHQAASLAKYAKLSIPYLLQWEAIKEAKKRGCKIYDFWGYTDPQKYPKHPWAGPTLFKMGFGGRAFEYVKTQDYPLSNKYWLTYIFEKIRKVRRGL